MGAGMALREEYVHGRTKDWITSKFPTMKTSFESEVVVAPNASQEGDARRCWGRGIRLVAHCSSDHHSDTGRHGRRTYLRPSRHTGKSAPVHNQRKGEELTSVESEDSTQAHDQKIRVIDGKEVIFDEEGFLINPESWTETIAEALATETGLPSLTGRQWEMIYFLRSFYLSNGRAPLNRDIKKQTGLSLLELERLFPGGIQDGAGRLAGRPNPKSC